jgi:hypothetical protein
VSLCPSFRTHSSVIHRSYSSIILPTSHPKNKYMLDESIHILSDHLCFLLFCSVTNKIPFYPPRNRIGVTGSDGRRIGGSDGGGHDKIPLNPINTWKRVKFNLIQTLLKKDTNSSSGNNGPSVFVPGLGSASTSEQAER